MKCLVFPGLGADRRAFSKINYPKQWQIEYVDWPIVETSKLSIGSFLKQINESYGDDFQLLIGLSFGSVIANEYRLMFDIECKLILISGYYNQEQLAFQRKLSGLVSLIPDNFFFNL